jgi:hypothetical protein
MLTSALDRAERKIRRLRYEHAYAFATDGRLIFDRTDNAPASIAFSADQMLLLRDAVLTHNHPGGRSLSEDDLLVAIDADLAQIRAVTSTHRYWISRPLQGWTAKFQERLRTALAVEDGLLIRRLQKDIAAGRISPEAADGGFHHMLWSILAAHGVVRYASEHWDD